MGLDGPRHPPYQAYYPCSLHILDVAVWYDDAVEADTRTPWHSHNNAPLPRAGVWSLCCPRPQRSPLPAVASVANGIERASGGGKADVGGVGSIILVYLTQWDVHNEGAHTISSAVIRITARSCRSTTFSRTRPSTVYLCRCINNSLMDMTL